MHELFSFDGTKSKEMNIKIISTTGDFSRTPYSTDRSFSTDFLKDSMVSYNELQTYRPLEFDVTFGFLDEQNQWGDFTPTIKREIYNWFHTNHYAEFYTYDDPGRIMYVKMLESDGLIQGGDNSARFTIKFRTNAPCFWTPLEINNYDIGKPFEQGQHSVAIPTDGEYQYEKFRELKQRLKNTTTMSTQTRTFSLFNHSNVVDIYRPVLYVTGYSDTDFEIINYSNRGKRTYLNSLKQGETVAIDNQNNAIMSSTPMRVPSKHFNYEWFEMVQGENILQIKGHVELRVVAQYPII